jgi:mono/diheme cytochrome c family protein
MKKSLGYGVSLLSTFSILLVSLIACASSKVEYTPANDSSVATSLTFEMLAARGESIYSSDCASCHGANGEGNGRWPTPALWGPTATLGTYVGVNLFENASDMLNVFMPALMPLSAKGSLSHDECVSVLCYILVQDNRVSPSTMYDESGLRSIDLK